MNETDAMTLLANANPIRLDDLEPLAVPSFARRGPSRPLALAIAVSAAATSASLIAVFVFSGAAPSRGTSVGPGALRPGNFTLGVNPFGASGKLLTLQQLVADKAAEGWSMPLPDSPLANSSNVGSVWENTSTGGSALYYPSSGIELWYGGTGIDTTGTLTNDVQTINGVKALVFPAGAVDRYAQVSIPLPGSHAVTLYGLGSVSDLLTVAQSILDRSQQ